jgi:hypothetical protein
VSDVFSQTGTTILKILDTELHKLN